MIDTPILIVLLVALALVVIILVTFFSVRWLLISAFTRPTNAEKTLRSEAETIYNAGPGMSYPVQTISHSDEMIIVNLPPNIRTNSSQRLMSQGQGAVINPDAICFLRGKRFRDCIRDCNCEDREEITQKLFGRGQPW